MRWIVLLCCLAMPAWGQGVQMAGLNGETAQAVRDVVATMHGTFARMPAVRLTSAIGEVCGGDGESSGEVRYCTGQNVIFVAADLAARRGADWAAYAVAHQAGHGVQVRHGIADVALRLIVTDRAREAEYRGWVTRQVECIAGVLIGRSGGALPEFGAEPFTGSHWGRAPLSNGPKVSIGAAERRRWLEAGFRARDFSACGVGEFGAELILRAEQ